MGKCMPSKHENMTLVSGTHIKRKNLVFQYNPRVGETMIEGI